MKTLAALLLLTLFSFRCAAQIDEEKVRYLQKVEKFRKMKTAGQVLTLGGTVLVVVGTVMLSNVETTTNGYGQTSTTGNIGGGVVAVVAGAYAVGGGVPLWIVGGIKKGSYERKLQTVSVSLNVSQHNNGVGIRYRF